MEGTRPLCGDHSESFTKRGGGEEEEERKRRKEEEREWRPRVGPHRWGQRKVVFVFVILRNGSGWYPRSTTQFRDSRDAS